MSQALEEVSRKISDLIFKEAAAVGAAAAEARLQRNYLYPPILRIAASGIIFGVVIGVGVGWGLSHNFQISRLEQDLASLQVRLANVSATATERSGPRQNPTADDHPVR